MKFHQALAGLTLIFPFAVVGETRTEWGIDLTPVEPVNPDKVGGTRRDRSLEQIQNLPTDRRQLLTANEFCGMTILSRGDCDATRSSDTIPLDLTAGTMYIFKVTRITCALDPVSELFPPGDLPYVGRNDDAATRPLECANTGPYGDPLIFYEALQSGTFELETFPYANICPSGGYEYSLTTTCTPHPTGDAGAQGDPHFKTWSGNRFDFHGVCDLNLLQNTEFESGLGLDVHIRTHMRRDMSYISSAVLRIGTDVLEVESQGVYYLNGVLGADLPSDFGGFDFLHTQPTDKQHVFEVHLDGRERIKIKTFKDFVSVLFEQAQGKHFGKSVGLMGAFGTGHMIARDGKTVIDDANAFGQEWQVLDTEPSLFQSQRFPQHPAVCTMPTPMQASQLRRRLLESSVDELAAEKACEHWGEGKDDCVFDVLTTGDLEMAMVGAY
jgi:hypothetical protein